MKHEGRGLEISIVGRSCRFAGANSISALWQLLREGRCSITEVPSDRWCLERFGHPRAGERGRSYNWAAGILDDIWGFDPGVFGLSPREAEQMDPQQRLLLELCWEALEDAGLPPSSLAGSDTGVFVGASTVDHGQSWLLDMAASDAYFATGNAASVLANRISYVFDFHGPSFVIDTACSSSLVALDAAVQALQSGRIHTAIVGGVNILGTPFQFVSFSQASMLSRTGRCQAFSAAADGYVRAEGGAVLVLQSAAEPKPGLRREHARIVATGVNSDGRTNGIALPSPQRQARLLQQIYERNGLNPNRLAFVEAHGTGTPVGDPVEATALGEVLGSARREPLPIGSIKSNIGHTEPAAGLAGILKAMLALEHDLLPPTLHCDTLNPHVDFERMGLSVARTAVPLRRERQPRLAGVSSYGFGGTNAHVVIADAPGPSQPVVTTSPAVLLISAQSRSALSALATSYAVRLDRQPDMQEALVAAANHRRDRLSERLVVPIGRPADMAVALRRHSEADSDGGFGPTAGTAVARKADVAFVFSGNGSQWAGMGRAVFRTSRAFRTAFRAVDDLFNPTAGWSLVDKLGDERLAVDLARTSVAQPLLFALQVATSRALLAAGLAPAMTLGHSVGEIAAAETAGLISLEQAVHLVYCRSQHQEAVAGHGGMAVLIGPRAVADTLVAEIDGLAIAALNSARATTLSGSNSAIEQAGRRAKSLQARLQKLDIPYPFHSALIDPIREPFLADLGPVPFGAPSLPFVSTVTGGEPASADLDGTYWWRNVREPVRFSDAIEAAHNLGARIFLEIGPHPILLSHISDTLAAQDATFAALPVLDRQDRSGNPIAGVVAAALARGAAVDDEAVLGTDPARRVDLPSYPWQRKSFRLENTAEAVRLLTPVRWHPLVGARSSTDGLDWDGLIDTVLLPRLADHVVSGHVLLPGMAFVEMAFAVARDWTGSATAHLADLRILQPLILDDQVTRETRCRIHPQTTMLEIMSRPRLSHAAWQVHLSAKILRGAERTGHLPRREWSVADPALAGDIYGAASAAGLAYGPAFRLLRSAARLGPRRIGVELVAGDTDDRFVLDPVRADACLHGLTLLYGELAEGKDTCAYVPITIADVHVLQPSAAVCSAEIVVTRADSRAIVADLTLFDEAGDIVASMTGFRLQAVPAVATAGPQIEVFRRTLVSTAEPLGAEAQPGVSVGVLLEAAERAGCLSVDPQPSPDYVLLEGWAITVALALCQAVSDGAEVIDLPSATAMGRLSTAQANWCERLLIQLVASGLAKPGLAGQFRLTADAGLPDPEAVLRSLAQEHPDRSAELLLAAHATTALRGFAAGLPPEGAELSVSALDAYDLGGSGAIRSADRVSILLDEAGAYWPTAYAPRLLQVGDGPLTERLAELVRGRDATLTIVEPNRRRLERARLTLNGQPRVTFLEDYDLLETGAYDMVIASETLQQAFGDVGRWRRLGEALAPGAVLLAAEPSQSLFREVVFGCPHLVGEGSGRAAPLSAERWRRALADLPLDAVTVAAAADADLGWLCLGEKRRMPRAHAVSGAITIIADREAPHEIVAALRAAARAAGIKVSAGEDLVSQASVRDPQVGPVVYLSTRNAVLPVGEEIARRCLALRDAAHRHGTTNAAFWVVCSGAIRFATGFSDEVNSAVWAFARTLANERQTLDLRLIDLDPSLPPERGAQRLLDVVVSGTDEAELVVDEASTRAVRFETAPSARGAELQPCDRALRLVKGDGGGLDRIRWVEGARRAPGPGEVEIEVKAAGLNFRDVMWGLSLLPEEILEDGYAGATLGLECSGVVARVGPGAEDLQVGDAVIAFARSALSSHVTIEARYAARRPDGWSFEAAATVPVAFLTAYYALVDAARLNRDEWVLIHGGAGGVGLAALQIALWRGARVIATAGSAERRELLTVLGAEHVFDSRSMDFVDHIQQRTGGVHVVLNSLSGEAMERSLAVLRPFGRFVELGKRDYVANTHVGLRPFRRNLSYHGVDLDQLMSRDDDTGARLFGTITDLFGKGVLSPLPHRVFAGRAIVDAFRLMQRSGHIGKIVIHPPLVPANSRLPMQPFVVSPTGIHLITGGLSGFGLETARWLVDRGARRLVLVGRSGASQPEAEAALAAFKAAGVVVEVAALDIADEAAVTRLFAAIANGNAPLAGVIHAATSYDDAIADNLDAERFEAGLRAKVEGAALLNRLTRSLTLDYFILFSSATTLVGNPGQGAYVAANAFCEALARRRRHEGYPAMAVAWGAIEDVGVLTRSGATPRTLLARSGVKAMPARAALDRFAAVLPLSGKGDDDTMLAVAAVDWSGARAHLRTLRSPTFSLLTSLQKWTEGDAQTKVSVQDLVGQHGQEGARTLIADAVRDEIARILRLPADDIGRNKPLMEIGLDSLMGVELAMGLEQRFTLQAPLSASAGAMTVNELADFVVGMPTRDRTVLDPVSARLAARHLDADTLREVEAVYPMMMMHKGEAPAPEAAG